MANRLEGRMLELCTSSTLFSGSPRYRAKHAGVGIDVDVAGHSAVECSFVFEG